MTMQAHFESDSHCGGDYYRIVTSSGKVVLVWDKFIDDDSKSVIEAFDSVEAMENGEMPNQIII